MKKKKKIILSLIAIGVSICAAYIIVDYLFISGGELAGLLLGNITIREIYIIFFIIIFLCIFSFINSRQISNLNNALYFQQQLLDAIPIPIFYKNDKYIYMGCNKSFESFLGLGKDDVIGKSVFELYPSDLANVYHEKDFELMNNPGVQFYEFEMQNATYGENRKVVFHKATFSKPNGKIAGLIGAFLDVTENRESEKVIIQERNKLDAVMSALGDGLTMQDTSYNILYQNAVHKQTMGDHKGELCFKAYQGKDQICEGCLLQQCFRDGQVHRRETCAETNGGKMYFEVSSSPVFGNQGEIIGGIETIRDITARKEMDERLRQAHKMEAVGTLAGGIAHDFNNILTAILGYAELVKLDIHAESPLKDKIELIIKAGRRAKEIIQQILLFGRKGSEQQQELQPALVVKEGLKLLRGSLPATIEINEEIASDSGCILANPSNIHQVLINLCTNALHAMENEKGVLTVKLARVKIEEKDASTAGVPAGTFVELLVSDTGCGMDQKAMERIFEPYFTTKGVGKGSGMGLAIAHGLVQGSGGFIKVESEPGKGSTFHVYFPAVEEGPAFGEEDRKPESLPVGNERILAVDDEEIIVGMYKETLERLGYKVTAQFSSEDTLEVLQTSPENFDLIITDQTMPRLPGSELAKAILQIRPDIPIILCTGFSSVVSEAEAKEIGIKRYLMKPVSRRDLAIAVREVLDKGKS